MHYASINFLVDAMRIFSFFLSCACLIRYNKSLLGEDLGRFPAPLLMNTFHFTLQAVLSRAITWFWSHRFEPRVSMSWRDYFVRGKIFSLILLFQFSI